MNTNHTPATFDLYKTLGEAFDPRKADLRYQPLSEYEKEVEDYLESLEEEK